MSLAQSLRRLCWFLAVQVKQRTAGAVVGEHFRHCEPQAIQPRRARDDSALSFEKFHVSHPLICSTIAFTETLY